MGTPPAAGGAGKLQPGDLDRHLNGWQEVDEAREESPMKSSSGAVRVPRHEEVIAPVTILDGQGRVVRVVPGAEFRGPEPPARGHWRDRRRRPVRPDTEPPGREDAARP